jgi:hypothetical protein
VSGNILDKNNLGVLGVAVLSTAYHCKDVKSAETVLAAQSVAKIVGSALAAVARQIEAGEVITGVSVKI